MFSQVKGQIFKVVFSFFSFYLTNKNMSNRFYTFFFLCLKVILKVFFFFKIVLQDEGDVDLEAGLRGRRRRMKKLKGQNKEGQNKEGQNREGQNKEGRRRNLKRKRLQGNKGRRTRPRNEDQEAEAVEE